MAVMAVEALAATVEAVATAAAGGVVAVAVKGIREVRSKATYRGRVGQGAIDAIVQEVDVSACRQARRNTGNTPMDAC